MKKIFVSFIILLMAATMTAAQEADLPDAGITPDSWMYGFKRFFEGVDMFFTFDPSAKAEKHLKHAELRLAEAREMAERGKPEFVDDLVGEYEENLKGGNEMSTTARQAGKNVSRVAELIALATSKHLSVLDGVLEKVPERAKEAIAKAKNASLKGHKKALRALSEDRPAKAAEINLNAIKARLNRAKEKASVGETGKVEEALEEYGQMTEISGELAETEAGVAEAVAAGFNQQLADLDETEERVPEQVRERIRERKSLALERQREALRKLAASKPERAAGIYSQAAEARLNRAKSKAEENEKECQAKCESECDQELMAPCIDRCVLEEGCGDNETCISEARDRCEGTCHQKMAIGECVSGCSVNCTQEGAEEVAGEIEEFEKLAHFGSEISQIARGLGKDTTTVEQLVAKATSRHLDMLAEVYEKVPEQAKPAIERAMNESARGREAAVEALKEKGALEDVSEEVPESVSGKIPEEVRERIGIKGKPETAQKGRP